MKGENEKGGKGAFVSEPLLRLVPALAVLSAADDYLPTYLLTCVTAAIITGPGVPNYWADLFGYT